MRVVADDLARIELVQRVESILDLAEDLNQLAVLLAEELGAGQAAALGAGDGPAGLEHDVVNAAGQRLQLGAIAGIGQIEKRPEPQPALAGVGVEGPGDVILLEQALEPLENRGEMLGGNRHVVDERDRPRPAAQPHQERFNEAAQAQQAFALGPFDGSKRLG